MSKEIQLTQGYIALIDDEDFERINRFTWCAAKSNENYYAIRKNYNESGTIRMHRVILNINDTKIKIDHIDNNSLNNQKSNLRIASNSENKRNQIKHKITSSKYKGVHFRKDNKKWRAGVRLNDQQINLGQFNNEIDAALAYNTAAIKYFGEFAKINVIKENI